MPTRVVYKGETIPSIALETGFYWKTIWNHAENAQLKELRKNQNVLAPGDKVFVPKLTPKSESRPTEQRHKFRRKGDPIEIVIKLMKGDKPRANEHYVFEIPTRSFEGTTDGGGILKHKIPADAKKGLLRLDNGNEIIHVKIGSLDPVDTITGVQQRLLNLGYDCRESGQMDEKTVRALSRFQSDNKLTVTGKIDDATKAKFLSFGQ